MHSGGTFTNTKKMVCIQGIQSIKEKQLMTHRTLWIFNNRLYYIDGGEIPCFPSEQKFDNSPSDKTFNDSCQQSLSSTRRLWRRKSMRLRKTNFIKDCWITEPIWRFNSKYKARQDPAYYQKRAYLWLSSERYQFTFAMPFIACIPSFWWTSPHVSLDTVLKEFSSKC